MTRTCFCAQNKEMSLLRKTKKAPNDNLNEMCVTDNKIFWKTVRTFLSDKVMTRDKIYLIKNDKNIKTDK